MCVFKATSFLSNSNINLKQLIKYSTNFEGFGLFDYVINNFLPTYLLV